MSTVTTFLNLIKAATIEQWSLSTLNNNLDKIDAGVSLATPVPTAVNTSDTNWSYNGTLYVYTDTQGKKTAHLMLQIVRIAGGAVAISTTPIQAMVLITAPNLPRNYSVTRTSVLQEGPSHASPGQDVWGLKLRIDKDGKFFISTDTGTSSISVGRQIEIDMWWSI